MFKFSNSYYVFRKMKSKNIEHKGFSYKELTKIIMEGAKVRTKIKRLADRCKPQVNFASHYKDPVWVNDIAGCRGPCIVTAEIVTQRQN